MEFIHNETRQEIRRTVNVVDGPALQSPNHAGGKKFRLKRLTVTFHLVGNEWQVYRVSAQGPVLRTGDAESKNVFDDTISSWDLKGAEWQFMDKVVEGLRPIGTATLPFGPFELED